MERDKRPPGIPPWAGNHPFPPDRKKPALIRAEDEVVTVYGAGREKISPRIFASTDKILMSSWVVPPGQTFEPPDIHSGDEQYYVLRGHPTIANPETGRAIQAKPGDAAFIPAKSWHCVYNFTEEEVEIVAIIEGAMWDADDVGKVTAFTLETVRYKGKEGTP